MPLYVHYGEIYASVAAFATSRQRLASGAVRWTELILLEVLALCHLISTTLLITHDIDA